MSSTDIRDGRWHPGRTPGERGERGTVLRWDGERFVFEHCSHTHAQASDADACGVQMAAARNTPPPTYKTLEAAARAYGAADGVYGAAGGWLYKGARRPRNAICQGWNSYGQNLVSAGIVIPLDEYGSRVDRSRGLSGGVTVRPYRMWRTVAHHFVLSEPAAAKVAAGQGGN